MRTEDSTPPPSQQPDAAYRPPDGLLAAEAPHYARLLDAAREYGVGLAFLPRGGRYRALPEALLGRPVVFVVADDYGGERGSIGPSGFDNKTLKRVLGGARAILLHAAAAEPWQYGAAAHAAMLSAGKAIIIETQPEHETEWLKVVSQHAPDAAILVITPEIAKYGPAQGRA